MIEDPLLAVKEGDSERQWLHSLFSCVWNWTGSGSQQITAVTSGFFQSMGETGGDLGYLIQGKIQEQLWERRVCADKLWGAVSALTTQKLCFPSCLLSDPVGLEFFKITIFSGVDGECSPICRGMKRGSVPKEHARCGLELSLEEDERAPVILLSPK